MTAWREKARFVADPLPADWREQLVRRLGLRPRRLGPWAELALYGARECLTLAGETALPPGAVLRLASFSGPRSATRSIASQAAEGLPMPFAFMQSQASHTLAALSEHLAWRGDARFVLQRDRSALQDLAELEARAAGATSLLFGWVEEDLSTDWRWLVPAD
jgi:hypothetical protein